MGSNVGGGSVGTAVGASSLGTAVAAIEVNEGSVAVTAVSGAGTGVAITAVVTVGVFVCAELCVSVVWLQAANNTSVIITVISFVVFVNIISPSY